MPPPLKDSYTVSFNTKGLVAVPQSIMLSNGSTIPKEKMPGIEHPTWVFDGWYKEAACINQWNLAVDTVTANITLYAKWTAKQTTPQDLWMSKTDRPNDYYRIPALAETKGGTLLAVTDLRYNDNSDLGNSHQIDLLIKYSDDHGLTWKDEKNLTKESRTASQGYGDAAIVADRESDKVLILCVWGEYGWPHYQPGNKTKRLKVAKLLSENGGQTFNQPEDITDSIYGLNPEFGTLFFGSGRIMQSHCIKKGSAYRLYTAILTKRSSNGSVAGNTVLYSDDFGTTWQILGEKMNSPVPNGDEAKLEELPNGDVIISSRMTKGRFFNIFTYTDKDTAAGSWQSSPIACTLGNGQATNGEILVTQARNTATGAVEHIVFQSLPAGNGGQNRQNVTIYWRTIKDITDFIDPGKWNAAQQKYLVYQGSSAYSTMVMQSDHRIGFLYERSARTGADYDICYETLPIHTITNGKYEAVFLKK